MIGTVIGFIALLQLSFIRMHPVAWKEYFVEYWLKEIQESMDKYIGCHAITEIMLKTVLNTTQRLKQSLIISAQQRDSSVHVWSLSQDRLFRGYWSITPMYVIRSCDQNSVWSNTVNKVHKEGRKVGKC